MKCHNLRLKIKQRYHEEETQNILRLGCILLHSKIPLSFLKITKMISIKGLISIEIAWFIPKRTLCFEDLAFTFFLYA